MVSRPFGTGLLWAWVPALKCWAKVGASLAGLPWVAGASGRLGWGAFPPHPAREQLRASDGAPSWADPSRLRAFLDAIDPERAGPREESALFTLLTAAAIERATRGTP